MSASPAVIRRLYKQILLNAQAFPSIKRDELVSNIKLEFRENAHLTDSEQVKEKLDVAMKGLAQLRSYTGFDDEDPNWSVAMTTTPMPQPEEPDTREHEKAVLPTTMDRSNAKY
jgi:hypothetical protein